MHVTINSICNFRWCWSCQTTSAEQSEAQHMSSVPYHPNWHGHWHKWSRCWLWLVLTLVMLVIIMLGCCQNKAKVFLLKRAWYFLFRFSFFSLNVSLFVGFVLIGRKLFCENEHKENWINTIHHTCIYSSNNKENERWLNIYITKYLFAYKMIIMRKKQLIKINNGKSPDVTIKTVQLLHVLCVMSRA